MTTPLAPELQAALDAAARAGDVVLAHYRRFSAIPDARADISTQADRDSQETILKLLHGRFPAGTWDPNDVLGQETKCLRSLARQGDFEVIALL